MKPKNKTLTLKLRVTTDDAAAMQRLADKYADGNLSAWLRRAALEHKPKK